MLGEDERDTYTHYNSPNSKKVRTNLLIGPHLWIIGWGVLVEGAIREGAGTVNWEGKTFAFIL